MLPIMIIFINLSGPTNQHDSRPIERPTRPTGTLFRVTLVGIFEPCMLPIDKWFSPSEKGRNTASLAFKSRLAFSVGIPKRDTSRWCFTGETRASNVTCIPMQKARRDLNASDAFKFGIFLM